MGRKGRWLTAMKKALNHESNKKSSQEENKKPKKKWFRKQKLADPKSTSLETIPTTTASPPQPVLQPVMVPPEPVKVSEAETEQTKHAYTVALAKAKVAEAEVVATQAAVEVRLSTTKEHFDYKSREEIAAIKIQTAFRGYMARRALRAVRGLMRLKTVMQGQAVKRQTTNTLKSMQTLVRLQSQVRERRQRMTGENQAHQKQLQQKHTKKQAKVLEKSKQNGGNWDSSRKTKEEIEVKLQSKNEASIKRERTLAYSFAHQQPWKASSRSASTHYMDPNGPHRGWSWLERWLAARPWEIATSPDNEFSDGDSPLVNSPKTITSGNEVTKSSTARLHNVEKPSPTPVPKHLQSNTAGCMFNSSAPKTVSSTSAARKLRSPSPKTSPTASMLGADDDDARSMLSVQSEQSRRSSVAGSSFRDDESLASSPAVPSYMAPTESAKAKSRHGNEAKVKSQSVTPRRSRRSTFSIADAYSVTEHT